MKRKARLIMGSALGLAAIAVAIDHTRHRLPEAKTAAGAEPSNIIILEDPCGLGGTNPCGLTAEEPSPCGLTPDNPCSL